MAGNNRAVHLVIQPRDRLLLSELAVMQIIDRELAKLTAGFTSTTRVNTRLLKLTRAGLLNRFFVGSVAAGRKAVYTLSRKGGLLVGTAYRRISRSHGKTLVGDLYVDHQMRINELYVALKHRPLPAGLRFLRWRSFHAPLSGNAAVVPDGYFELDSPSGVRSAFLEIDLGHQSMKVWEQKVRQYLAFALSGDFVRSFCRSQFRVLVVTTSPRRLESIRKAVARQTDKIFWLADFQTINRSGIWSPVWLRPTGEQMLPLM